MVDSLKTPWQDLRAQIEDRQDSVSTLVEGLTEWAIEFLGELTTPILRGCLVW